jgi:hypothetical protein
MLPILSGVMLDHCAACPRGFHRLGEGKIYAAEEDRNVEWFWLCGDCSLHFDVVQRGDGTVNVVPKLIDSGRGRAA